MNHVLDPYFCPFPKAWLRFASKQATSITQSDFFAFSSMKKLCDKFHKKASTCCIKIIVHYT